MIRIICVGTLKETYWKGAVEEYQKRLRKYTSIEVIEVADEATDQEEVARRKEAERMQKYISPKDFVVTLEIEGKSYTSPSFSQMIDKWFLTSSTITFIIGGSCGLDQTIKSRSNASVSFSSLTFPHQLFRVMLLEQIYRAYRIQHHEAYHK